MFCLALSEKCADCRPRATGALETLSYSLGMMLLARYAPSPGMSVLLVAVHRLTGTVGRHYAAPTQQSVLQKWMEKVLLSALAGARKSSY
jgi:hypothetical protein